MFFFLSISIVYRTYWSLNIQRHTHQTRIAEKSLLKWPENSGEHHIQTCQEVWCYMLEEQPNDDSTSKTDVWHIYCMKTNVKKIIRISEEMLVLGTALYLPLKVGLHDIEEKCDMWYNLIYNAINELFKVCKIRLNFFWKYWNLKIMMLTCVSHHFWSLIIFTRHICIACWLKLQSVLICLLRCKYFQYFYTV